MFQKIANMLSPAGDDIPLSEIPDLVTNSDKMKEVKTATVVWYRDAIRTLIDSIGEDVPLSQLRVSDLRKWQKEQEKAFQVRTSNGRKRSISSQLNKLAVLGHLESYRDHGRTVAKLADCIQLKPEPRSAARAMREATYKAMYAKADLKWRAVLSTFWHTGIRRAELVSIPLDKFQLWNDDDGVLCCKFFVTGKADYKRWVACRGAPAEMLQDYRYNIRLGYATSDRLFTSHDGAGPMGIPTVNSAFRKLWSVADIPKSEPRTPHTMRHAFILRMLQSHPHNIVAAMVGISASTMIENYVQPHDEMVLDAMLSS